MNRVVVITGAGQGIGKEIALTISERGDTAVIIDKEMVSAKETERMIRLSGSVASSYCADLTSHNEVSAVFAEIVRNHQKIDVLINNAGYYLLKSVEELNIEIWNSVIDANMKTAFLCSLEAFKYMKIASYGKIINMTSTTAFTSGAGLCPYISAKAGVIGLTRAMAVDMGPYNITVNAIAAGLITSENAVKVFGEDRFDKTRGLKVIKRDQQPADLMGTVFFLMDTASDFITGQTICVDGGRVFL